MPFTTLPTVTTNQAVRASWGNLVKTDLDDHESRIGTLEGAGGTGDVVGPASATDHAIARYDLTTGKLIQNSGITIADGATGALSGTNSGDVTLAGSPNYLTIAAQVLTRTLINLASHVTGRLPFANLVAATSANRLIGRGSSAGAGDMQEIVLGTNLSMSGTTLNASGGAGGTLDDLTDVSTTTPASNDVLVYDGANWVNAPVPGGAGNETDTGAAGSEPAGSPGPAAGDLYFPNNGMYVERYSGSVWAPWGPIYPMTPFVDSGFTWDNQGGASLDLTFGNAYFHTPAASGTNVRAYVKTAPATPYSITIAYTPMLSNSGTNFATGLVFRESGSGKIINFYFNNTEAINVAKWTNSSTFSASYTVLGLHTGKRSGGLAFLRITDNGTNRICAISVDGQHWETVHSVGRTDFLTADQVGVFVYADSATTTLVTAMSLLSWKEA